MAKRKKYGYRLRYVWVDLGGPENQELEIKAPADSSEAYVRYGAIVYSNPMPLVYELLFSPQGTDLDLGHVKEIMIVMVLLRTLCVTPGRLSFQEAVQNWAYANDVEVEDLPELEDEKPHPPRKAFSPPEDDDPTWGERDTMAF